MNFKPAKISTLGLILFLFACGNSGTPSEKSDSYFILSNIPIFCEGGRVLVKDVRGRINVWCGEPGKTAITIRDGDEHLSLVGMNLNGDALEYIARSR